MANETPDGMRRVRTVIRWQHNSGRLATPPEDEREWEDIVRPIVAPAGHAVLV